MFDMLPNHVAFGDGMLVLVNTIYLQYRYYIYNQHVAIVHKI